MLSFLYEKILPRNIVITITLLKAIKIVIALAQKLKGTISPKPIVVKAVIVKYNKSKLLDNGKK